MARTKRRFYDILNPLLYQRNAADDHPAKSCLLWAAKSGCLQTIKLGLLHGGDVDVQSMTADDWKIATGEYEESEPLVATPLQVATSHNHLEIMECLLENGASPHHLSQNVCECGGGRFRYPLHDALYHCNDDSAARKLIHYGAYLEGPDSPALHVTATLNKLHIFKSLLELPGVKADALDKSDFTALHYAAKMGSIQMVDLLLARPEVDAGAEGTDLRTPLHFAAQYRRLAIVKRLLEQSEVDVDAEDESENTAIDVAFSWKAGQKRCSVQLIEALLSRRELDAVVNKRRWIKVLCLAAARGRMDVIKFLLDRGDVSAEDKDHMGNTPLHGAVLSDDDRVVRLILRQPGVDVNMSGESGTTALHWAMGGSGQVVQALIDAGADVQRQGPFGTPLRTAVRNCNNPAIQALLEHGADPSVTGFTLNDGLSLLHHCFQPVCEQPDVEEDADDDETTSYRIIVQRLVDSGADVHIVSTMRLATRPPQPCKIWRSDGTPLFFATIGRETELMDILLEAGARADAPVYDRLMRVWQSFLVGLFRHEFEVYPFRKSTAQPICTDQVEGVRDRVKLLLNYGARLDADAGQSALEYACEVAHQGITRHDLLWLLLWNSSSRNVALEHVESVRRLYSCQVDVGDLEDSEAANCRKIVQRLTGFIHRAL